MTPLKNYWAEFIKLNDALIIDRNLASRFQAIPEAHPGNDRNYDNYFWLDGWSSDGHWSVLSDLLNNRDQVKYPTDLKSGTTLFFNTTEGYCTDEIFKAIHATIDFCKLDASKCYYFNCATNVQDIYTEFCDNNNITNRLAKCYENNCYNNYNHSVYRDPTIPVKELAYEDKKLYCCFNWNAWHHRLAIIAALNYYDLIDQGYVTSPGIDKFKYNPEQDFQLLVRGSQSYLIGQPELPDILDRLNNLRNKYPLILDDRTTFNRNTDFPLYDLVYKAPGYEARINSLIELVTETRFNKEQFFSEKSFWSIKLGKPFIQLNAVHSLKGLRSLGYKTFSPYINEDYDDEIDNGRRVLMIAQELSRLQTLRMEKPAQFKEIYEQMQAIAKYNQERFLANAL